MRQIVIVFRITSTHWFGNWILFFYSMLQWNFYWILDSIKLHFFLFLFLWTVRRTRPQTHKRTQRLTTKMTCPVSTWKIFPPLGLSALTVCGYLASLLPQSLLHGRTDAKRLSSPTAANVATPHTVTVPLKAKLFWHSQIVCCCASLAHTRHHQPLQTAPRVDTYPLDARSDDDTWIGIVF